MSRVALLGVDSYDYNLVNRAWRRGLELLGLQDDLAAPGEEVLVKPNLLMAAAVEDAVCTHPVVLETVLAQLQDLGARPRVGDSPGFGSVGRAARKCGVAQVCRWRQVPLVSFAEKVEVSHPDSLMVSSFPLAREAVRAERSMINLARWKTHNLTRITGGIKNLFGCVPGPHKVTFHLRLQQEEDFAAMLAELYGLLRPRLTVLDAIVAMEGPGPRRGTPRFVGALILSPDAVAADAVGCAVTGLDPRQVPTLRQAAARGLGTMDLEAIELVGDNLQELRVAAFRHVSGSPQTLGVLPPIVARLARRHLTARPVIIPQRCVGCGICRDHCPPGAITLEDNQACIDQKRCMRCYCCHELCPHGAVDLRSSLLHSLTRKLLP